MKIRQYRSYDITPLSYESIKMMRKRNTVGEIYDMIVENIGGKDAEEILRNIMFWHQTHGNIYPIQTPSWKDFLLGADDSLNGDVKKMKLEVRRKNPSHPFISTGFLEKYVGVV